MPPAGNELREYVAQAVESRYIEEGRRPKVPQRTGWGVGIPIGGATANNQGSNLSGGPTDRPTWMSQLLNSYLSCPVVSACVDVIARTCTAGGIDVAYNPPPFGAGGRATPQQYDDEGVPIVPDAPQPVQDIQQLLHYVNPQDDIRQLMTQVVTDLLIFGDSYTEVVWIGNEPVALYPLDSTTMTILADEHGMITGYSQVTQTNRTALFAPREVIHVKYDTPGDTLYGLSPTQKAIIPIMTWLFAAGLMKETMRRGDPLRIWIDWPLALPESERNRFSEQFFTRNLGSRNIGNPLETKGQASVKELGVNQLNHWLDVLNWSRDLMFSEFGVPPSKAQVIESGNIGGGTATSQDKNFRVNTCGPVQERVLEKFAFRLMFEAYGITDWTLKFGVVDWRDDEIIEQIRDQRIRNGSWTLNRARGDIGEPPVPGGDDAVLVDRQNMVLWADLAALSKANLQVVKVAGQPKNNPAPGDTTARASKPAQTAAANPNPEDPKMSSETFAPFGGWNTAVADDDERYTDED